MKVEKNGRIEMLGDQVLEKRNCGPARVLKQ